VSIYDDVLLRHSGFGVDLFRFHFLIDFEANPNEFTCVNAFFSTANTDDALPIVICVFVV
jgi:hypothetical protein